MSTTITLPDEPRPARKAGSIACLAVVAHYDRPLDPPGMVLRLRDGVAMEIGRGSLTALVERDHAVRLDLGDRHASGRHARIVGDQLEDLGSRNGTLVNGIRVESAQLRDGDFVELGRTLLQLRRTPEDGADSMLALAEVLRGTRQATLSPIFLRELERVRHVAGSTLPLVIHGETGAGKEELARAIHTWSGRAGELVAVNCAAIPTHLAESELFGHRRGAFTGADRDRVGLLTAAHGGTLLLDEVDALPAEVQPKLLRFLQDKLVRRVGETTEREVDVRVLAASNADLDAAVDSGRFRADLLARLRGLLVRLPPLRDRKEDLGLLVAGLLRRHLPAGATAPRLTPEAWRVLVRRSWPSNVRELERCLEAGLLLARDGVIDEAQVAAQTPAGRGADDATAPVARPPEPATRAARTASRPARTRTASEAERELRAALAEHRGNLSAISRAMGVSRMQVYRWMSQFGLSTEESRDAPEAGTGESPGAKLKS
ncbi:MAG: sigma 54-interacting transcriptional regulator [Deltaproteobacteria bacterium]|nr:sigma 54-interacting transcriptional regulator [Deltaproteobacteria bacterium]